ncbi:hypothetical protein SAMN02745206_02529 [Desulfacinum infernum DSM 9756]|uniref:Uncharacterized protein n=2 Tax=Desulfacinum infernum TaxID=35837 RepID=A0A1M5DXF9_9BACT|nr:hypothetical protein SAMN02745206_02529 [Desulfacinum infernum DSM 9756]
MTMRWQAIVCWRSEAEGGGGWHWRVFQRPGDPVAEGAASSQEEGLRIIREKLLALGVDPARVSIEIWDEGAWDKC